mgnify:CR=1 FL=1
MKNRIAKKVCAAALAGLMTMALVPTSVFAAGTMTIGVTSFADTLEPQSSTSAGLSPVTALARSYQV